jgi:hypothetical protein
VKKGAKAAGRKTRRFVPAPGASCSKEDARLIGRELQKIADAQGVQHFRELNERVVFETIEADKEHPLRRFYDWNMRDAARRHWIECTRKLIRSVQMMYTGLRREVQLPMTTVCMVPRTTGNGGTYQARILSEDALRGDPQFVSTLARIIRRNERTLRELETWTECAKAPADIVELRDGLREAYDRYFARTASAAE